MKCRLRLHHPRTFQEKIQWLKLYDRRPEYVAMTDKVAVKEIVARRIGSKYIIPTFGVWDNFDDIDFDTLPQRFVLKTSQGDSCKGVVVCTDRTNFDIRSARQKLNASLLRDKYLENVEWCYRDVPRRILAEEYIEMPGKDDLSDYKIYCFNGRPTYIQLIQDRHSGETIDFYDTDWNLLPFIGLNSAAHHATQPAPKPQGLQEMLHIAAILSQGIPFVRVDLYNIYGRILFGELTFYPSSGLAHFSPPEWDRKLGDMLILP